MSGQSGPLPPRLRAARRQLVGSTWREAARRPIGALGGRQQVGSRLAGKVAGRQAGRGPRLRSLSASRLAHSGAQRGRCAARCRHLCSWGPRLAVLIQLPPPHLSAALCFGAARLSIVTAAPRRGGAVIAANYARLQLELESFPATCSVGGGATCGRSL